MPNGLPNDPAKTAMSLIGGCLMLIAGAALVAGLGVAAGMWLEKVLG